LPITPDETIQTVMPMPEDKEQWDIMNVVFSTAKGNIRRNMLSDFTNIKRNGKIAMKLADNDRLISVMPCHDDAEILIATSNGKAIRFGLDQIRVFRGRDSTGVRGIRLLQEDEVVSMSILDQSLEQYILAVTENGYGKRTKVSDYRVTNRGGQGVANIVTSPRNGKVVASFAVVEDDQLMMATDQGKVIRIRVSGGEGDNIRVAGRQTQGVTLFSVDENEKLVSVGVIQEKDHGEGEGEGEGEDEVSASDEVIDDTVSVDTNEAEIGDDNT